MFQLKRSNECFPTSSAGNSRFSCRANPRPKFSWAIVGTNQPKPNYRSDYFKSPRPKLKPELFANPCRLKPRPDPQLHPLLNATVESPRVRIAAGATPTSTSHGGGGGGEGGGGDGGGARRGDAGADGGQQRRRRGAGGSGHRVRDVQGERAAAQARARRVQAQPRAQGAGRPRPARRPPRSPQVCRRPLPLSQLRKKLWFHLICVS
jgi:hypothetical protein